MAFVLIASTGQVLGPDGGTTTTGIDTAGANLIVVQVSQQAGVASITDNKGNTGWTASTRYSGTGATETFFYYFVSPAVGSGHTFTLSGSGQYSCINVLAFSGVDTASPVDAQSGDTSVGANSSTPSSITPAVANELFVSGCNAQPGATAPTITGTGWAIPSGLAQAGGSGNNYAGGAAYKISTGSGAESPTWNFSITQPCSAGMIAFKPSTGGGFTAVSRRTFGVTGTRIGARKVR